MWNLITIYVCQTIDDINSKLDENSEDSMHKNRPESNINNYYSIILP